MADPTPVVVTPGWKTSEFWLSLAAMLVGAVLSSGIIPSGSIWTQIVGVLATILGALGYQVARTAVKTGALAVAEAKAAAVVAVATAPVATDPAAALKDAGK
jgi:hypothetical protein